MQHLKRNGFAYLLSIVWFQSHKTTKLASLRCVQHARTNNVLGVGVNHVQHTPSETLHCLCNEALCDFSVALTTDSKNGLRLSGGTTNLLPSLEKVLSSQLCRVHKFVYRHGKLQSKCL